MLLVLPNRINVCQAKANVAEGLLILLPPCTPRLSRVMLSELLHPKLIQTSKPPVCYTSESQVTQTFSLKLLSGALAAPNPRTKAHSTTLALFSSGLYSLREHQSD